ncbi:hypothetical protein FRC12_020064 [Ceratobasidium sp. 428]|nr:hypothetical protein FRC12_020064 [Ceratobasidium sp. 428]
MSEAKQPDDNNNNGPQEVFIYDTASSDGHFVSPMDDIVMRPETIDTGMAEELGDAGSTTTYADQLRVLLLIEDRQFIVHAPKIKEFTSINSIMENTPEGAGMQIVRLHESANEFAMMLEVLYTPIYQVTTFSVDTLVSTLAMATKYKHSRLREYTVQILGSRQHELPAVRRIKVSQAYNIPEWAPSAIDELCKRQELISLEEANKLGADVFMAICRQRELRENASTKPPKNVVSTVAITALTGISYFVLFLGLLLFIGEIGRVATYIFGAFIGVFGKIAVRVGRTIVRTVVNIWMFFDPGTLLYDVLGN